MKTLIFIVGGIVILITGVGVYSFVTAPQEAKDEFVVSTNLTKNTLGRMVSSDDKIKEAQRILSQTETTNADQAKARKLIDEAIIEARKAAEAQPDNPRTWYYLSKTYEMLTDISPKAIALSIDALNNAITLDKDNAVLLNERATMYIMQKKYPEAVKDLQQAIKLDPRKANHFYKLGNVYRVTGKKEEARILYLEAKKLTPTDNIAAIAQIDHQIKQLEEGESKKAKN